MLEVNGQSEIERLLEEMDRSLERGLIPARIFNDPEIHRLELERLFARAWVFVGHETEIPRPGDYCLRYIGQDPFIFVRDEAGSVRVLFNACRHRGVQVCRAERGNASHFRCVYHGWTYKNTGELIGIPAAEEAYKGFDKSAWGLLPAPQVASIHGLVFASLDPQAPPLETYLGGMKWYLDLLFGLTEEGMEVIGEPHRWILEANWKIAADNFAGDDYHTLYLHKSMWDVNVFQVPPRANMMGYHVQAGNGHTISFSIAPDPNEPGPTFWGYPQEIIARFCPDRVSREQFELARRSRVSVGTIFPNLSFLTVPLTADPDRISPTTFMTVRQWQPKGPDRMEIWSWALTWKEASPEFRERSYQACMASFSPSGIFEQDDTVPWPLITKTAGTVFFGRRNEMLNYQMGLDGIGAARPVTDWPGPGVVYSPRYEEGVQRHFYRRWLEYMRAG